MSELDVALELFQRRSPEFGPGLANHGPMACEALQQLGHEALIPGFVERYAPRLPPRPAGTPIPDEERPAARGDPSRLGDWISSWESALEVQPWRALLVEQLPALLPGCFASAGHGLLRVAHAVRALEEAETAPRRAELAHGLGLWSARYQTLPGVPEAGPERLDAERLFARVPVVPPESRRPGLFFDQVLALDQAPGFARAVECLALDGDLLAAASRACAAAARLYLGSPASRVAYAHTVTVPAALRLLAPVLPAATLRAAAGHALQAAAALHAVSCAPQPAPDAERAGARELAGREAEIRYRAACSLDEHAIKLAEACLREDRLAPDPALRLAAADAALHIGEGAQRAC